MASADILVRANEPDDRSGWFDRRAGYFFALRDDFVRSTVGVPKRAENAAPGDV